MDEHNFPDHLGEEGYYQPYGPGAGKVTEPSFRRNQRLIPILIGIITILVVVLGLVVGRLLTTPSPNLPPPVGFTTPTVAPSSQVTSTSMPTTTPTVAPSSQVIPTSMPTVTPTAALPCVVNVGTWTGGSADWKSLNGTLLNDGTNHNFDVHNGPTIVAPCQLGNTTNYAVETKIKVISGWECFGVTVRGSSASSNWQGYMASARDCFYRDGYAYLSGPGLRYDSSARWRSFNPGTNLRTYRVEVNGNIIKFLIDGNLLLTLEDNRYLTGSQVGLWSSGVQLQVTSFEVTSL